MPTGWLQVHQLEILQLVSVFGGGILFAFFYLPLSTNTRNNTLCSHWKINFNVKFIWYPNEATTTTNHANSIELQRNYPIEQYKPHAENDEHDSESRETKKIKQSIQFNSQQTARIYHLTTISTNAPWIMWNCFIYRIIFFFIQKKKTKTKKYERKTRAHSFVFRLNSLFLTLYLFDMLLFL